ncbi:MAG: PDZ domain-containing protein, partial [Gammaproteobacteria bacterium]|nr:PDZ domain-containing protein [Gammaproteobacteria bacterium]
MFDSLAAYLQAALISRRSDRQQRLNHIGIAVARLDDRHLVSAVLDNSPAFAAGLKRGDHLLTVNGETYHPVYSFNTEPPSPPQPDNRVFQLAFARRGEQQEVAVTPVFNNLFDSYRNAVE